MSRRPSGPTRPRQATQRKERGMAGNIKLIVCRNPDEVAKRCAGLYIEQVRNKPESVLGFATGSTPEKTYVEIAKLAKAEKVSFSKALSFNLDEYWGLDGDHDQSYRYFMNERLFNHI